MPLEFHMNINWEHLIMHLNKHLRCWTILLVVWMKKLFMFNTENTRDYARYLDERSGCNISVHCKLYFITSPEKKPLYYYWPHIQSVLCLSSSSAALELWLSTSRTMFALKKLASAQPKSVLHQSTSKTLNKKPSTKTKTHAQDPLLFTIISDYHWLLF